MSPSAQQVLLAIALLWFVCGAVLAGISLRYYARHDIREVRDDLSGRARMRELRAFDGDKASRSLPSRQSLGGGHVVAPARDAGGEDEVVTTVEALTVIKDVRSVHAKVGAKS